MVSHRSRCLTQCLTGHGVSQVTVSHKVSHTVSHRSRCLTRCLTGHGVSQVTVSHTVSHSHTMPCRQIQRDDTSLR
ncbi:uncharacterized, partial [Tachysurus ichikawai]